MELGGGAGNFLPPIAVLLRNLGLSSLVTSIESIILRTGELFVICDDLVINNGGKEGGVEDFSGVVSTDEFDFEGTGGKALISLFGLKLGLEALDGTTGLDATDGGDTMSSGEAKGGLEGLLEGDCLGGREGGASDLVGETDLTVLTLALELKESLEEVKLILLSVLTGGGGGLEIASNVNLVGLGGAGAPAPPNSYLLGGNEGIEDLGGGGGGGKLCSGGGGGAKGAATGFFRVKVS